MSVMSKKRRLARRAASRAGEVVQDNNMFKLFDALTQITNKQIKTEKVKPFLSMSVWLKAERSRKNHRKVFRAERREHKLELQRAAEKAQRTKNRKLAEMRAERRAQRKAIHG